MSTTLPLGETKAASAEPPNAKYSRRRQRIFCAPWMSGSISRRLDLLDARKNRQRQFDEGKIAALSRRNASAARGALDRCSHSSGPASTGGLRSPDPPIAR